MSKARTHKAALLASVAIAFASMTGSVCAGSAEGLMSIEGSVEPSAPRFSWEGYYAGAQVNWFHLIDGTGTRDGTGAMGGVHAGIRGDLGEYTLGFEIEANTVSINLNSGDRVDAYFAGKMKFGVPLGRLHLSATFAPTVYTGTLGTSTGIAYGGGIDYMFDEKWIVGVEYLNHSISGWGTPLPPTTPNNNPTQNPSAEAGSVTFRASYKF